MKVAISLPDDLFRAGDALANWMKVTRSELYARALTEYLAKHRADQVTQRLNAIYAIEGSTWDSGLARIQARSLPRDEW